MVNYRDPAKVARDLCAYALSSGLVDRRLLAFFRSFLRDCRETLAYR
jgi:hypothetical protein